jgi:lysophospholipase L1-like esterase
LTGEDAPYFVGRWFGKDVNGENLTVTTTAGSHIYFLTENASSINVDFVAMREAETIPYFAYSIDGATPIRQKITEKTVNLPDSNYHTVRIIADGLDETSGKWANEIGVAFRNVTANGGSLVGIRPKNPLIFFYGDSITEGIRALSMELNSEGNSATNAYSWLTAEKLGATAYMIGYGGSGITASGSFNILTLAIDHLSKDRKIDTSLVTPDIIVVNHGSNDSNASSDGFKVRLKNALDKMRRLYPETPIVYMIPLRQAHANDIIEVVSGIDNTKIVLSSGLDITCTDSVHPDSNGANVVAEHLSSELIKIFGEDYFK